MRPESRLAGALVLALLLGGVVLPITGRAGGGATLVLGTTLPAEPSLDAVLRLDLQVRNDTGLSWAPGDLVHAAWQTLDGHQVADDARPLGEAVAPGVVVKLSLVALAPPRAGDFALTPSLVTGGSTLAIGAPLRFHLAGFLLRGRGNGHGLGMSQWGARGRAAAGQDYRTILAAYYRGSGIDTRDTSGSVRIALSHLALDLARPWARLFGPFPEVAGPVTVEGAQVRVGSTDVLGFGANADGQPVVFVQPAGGTPGKSIVIGGPLTIHPVGPGGIRTNLQQALDGDFRSGSQFRRYAGDLRVIPKGNATVRVVNVLPIEDYLKGVVPAEMPPYWGMAALQAQAVAARTYALRHLGGTDFDLEGNEFDQAYTGLSDQRASSSDAVTTTRGQVLTVGGRLIDALFTASNGGHSSDSEFGFIHWNHGLRPAARISYLRGISDPFDHAPGWQVGPLSPEGAATILRDSGEDVGDRLLGIDVLQRSPSGRIMGVRLRGSGSSEEISGPYLRALFGLPDTLVEIVGGS